MMESTRTPVDDNGVDQSALDEFLAFVGNLEAPTSVSGTGASQVTGTGDGIAPATEVDVDGPTELIAEVDDTERWEEERPVDELEAARDVHSSAPLSSSRSANNTPTDQPSKRRRRQKEELDYLRAHVQELEDQLQRLRSQVVGTRTSGVMRSLRDPYAAETNTKTAREDGTQRSTAIQQQQEQEQLSTREWRDLARREKDAAQRSLMENIHLRALLESQLSIARAFESALQERQLTTEDVAPYLGDKYSCGYVHNDTEEQIYASLARGLDALYAQVDTGLMSWQPATRKPAGEVTNRTDIRADARGMFLEHREHRIFPFPMKAVSRVVWDTMCTGSYTLDTGIFITRDHTEDTASIKVVDSFRLSEDSTKETIVTLRVSMKRVVEVTREVFVWQSLVETVGHICLRQRERVWSVFQPAVDELEESCETTTCVRVRPEMVVSHRHRLTHEPRRECL